MNRKIIQMFETHKGVFARCEDCTLWVINMDSKGVFYWTKMPNIPEDKGCD